MNANSFAMSQNLRSLVKVFSHVLPMKQKQNSECKQTAATMKTPCRRLSERCFPTALQKHHNPSLPSVLNHFSVLGDCNIDFTWNPSHLAAELQLEHSRTKLQACVALLCLARGDQVQRYTLL